MYHPSDGGLSTEVVPTELPSGSIPIRLLTMYDHLSDPVARLTVHRSQGKTFIVTGETGSPFGEHANLDDVLETFQSAAQYGYFDVEVIQNEAGHNI